MKHPLSRFAPSPSPAGGGRTQWPGKASSTGALVWAVPVTYDAGGAQHSEQQT
ncbi:hypothetical protein C8C98_2221 [Acidovorax sp. 106]|nr:hypothetical protein C8C98_2221 [Acidovorax sp. 106]